MSEDQFTKLFNYINQRFDDIDKKFDKVDDRFDQVMNVLVEHTGRFDDLEIEMAAINSHLVRHDWQIQKLADGAGVDITRPEPMDA